MSSVEIDLETRSVLDLTKVGAHVYFAHPSTQIILARFAFDQDEEIHQWFPGEPMPMLLRMHVGSGGEIRGWNVNFERLGWKMLLGPRHGWLVPENRQYSDNAAMAALMSLPRSLEDAARVLGLEEQKDDEGHRLMLQMSRPRPPRAGEDPSVLHWFDDLDRIARLSEYCAQDVRTSRAVRRKLKPMPPVEQRLWSLDMRINDRGVCIDHELVDAMTVMVQEELSRLDTRLSELTGGVVTACTQSVRLAGWVRSQGVECTSLAKGAYPALLARQMSDTVREALLVRQEASKASTSKLRAARIATGADHRARGMLLYAGADTGRWAGRLLQPHNMIRGSGTTNPEIAIPLIKQHRSVELLAFMYRQPMTVMSDCMRGILCAAPGKKIMSGDYSSVEARLTAWVAGDHDKLEAFRKADSGDGPGMYELAASDIYAVPVDEISHEDPRRQTGKTAELALGFGGGVNALAAMGLNYGIDMADAFPAMWDRTPADKRDKVTEKFHKTSEKGNAGNLSKKAWIACELVKKAWRDANPKIVQSWHRAHEAAWTAMSKPGVPVPVDGIPMSWLWDSGFLQLVLPSTRRLYYADPRVRNIEAPWSDKTLPRSQRERMNAVTVQSVDNSTSKFIRYPLYPGLGIQHTVQATARDLLGNGMVHAELAGFPLVLTVHDEVIAEVDPDASLADFLYQICRLPPYAEGLPLVAGGWEGPRYKK